MGKKVTLKQAAVETGFTEYFLYTGIRQRRLPHIRIGSKRGKIIFDLDLLNQYLEQEAADSVTASAQQSEIIEYGKLRKVNA